MGGCCGYRRHACACRAEQGRQGGARGPVRRRGQAAAAWRPSALSETHGDWTVNCQVTGANKVCSLSHQQFNKQSGQRLLAVELTTKTGQDSTGTLALPFGLALANGISLEIDDKKLDGTLQFNTCQAVGCLVPAAFDADTTPLMQNGTALNATAAVTTQPISFTISLNGFGSALARTADLSAD
ncbi:invasion associated locus B family protein [Mesorhizobium humile]|uniref:invasion associated locus B family protein n=1 Tax=Mesorhizobium humile TaxID=3072313 RepID=UPI002A23BF49|nr:invasion associated locus B family protein [Mesorhizobium sp. VK2D]MDX8461374.1 invasion associated locus B family protein [Mesorhizobium sp. VK2D]